MPKRVSPLCMPHSQASMQRSAWQLPTCELHRATSARQNSAPCRRRATSGASQFDPDASADTVLYRDDDGTTKAAVDGLDLDVAPGEVVALLGPNGAGKSTLVKSACGLVRPSSGSIAVAGAPAGSPAARAAIADDLDHRASKQRARGTGVQVAEGAAVADGAAGVRNHA